MKSNFIKKNYLEKIKKIQAHNNLYYNKSKPTIADQEYDVLKKELIKREYTFYSETDSEVLINLIEETQKQEQVKLGKAVQIALNQVVGAYGIVVFDRKNLMNWS